MGSFKNKKSFFSGKWIYISLLLSVLAAAVVAIFSISSSNDSDYEFEAYDGGAIKTANPQENIKKEENSFDGSLASEYGNASLDDDYLNKEAKKPKDSEKTKKSNKQDAILSDEKQQEDNIKPEKSKKSKSAENDKKSIKKDEKSNKEKNKSASNAKWKKPVIGKVITEFSGNELVESPTLKDWRTHNGIDVAAPGNGQVKSIADGTVIDISVNDGFGGCVTVECKNPKGEPIIAMFKGLAADCPVKVDQKVKAGDIIGTIAVSKDGEANENVNTMEVVEGSHLHLEILKKSEYEKMKNKENFAYENPRDYIDF